MPGNFCLRNPEYSRHWNPIKSSYFQSFTVLITSQEGCPLFKSSLATKVISFINKYSGTSMKRTSILQIPRYNGRSSLPK